jgi:hypothetical protein
MSLRKRIVPTEVEERDISFARAESILRHTGHISDLIGALLLSFCAAKDSPNFGGAINIQQFRDDDAIIKYVVNSLLRCLFH